MFALRFALLAFWAWYSWTMGQYPASGLNAFGSVVASSFFVAAPALYFFPSIEAWHRAHANRSAIALINLLAGWTLVGWVVAMVWAIKRSEPAAAPAPAPQSEALRKCPYCAEEIRVEAVKCKHCKSDVSAAVA